ncbi:hypothetical protein IMCC20628_02323 [Hoeflea sp. IMCC20628]|uniref:hypothetical protein n=1 Tax=Hoeflea sp. IMCC20628 TaxID=1620421 RepID=UPI00063BF6CE|nr:hypothetical protein [Hoeflea sp. IMCC20628]AKI01022.1 hypothetical protein IMCC20628_02323 [Hoeflea sp. IMCC20628]
MTPSSSLRERLLLPAGVLIAGLLLAALVYAALTEVGGKNSAALVADAFLNGRLWVETCFDLDCASFNGRTYVVFPPFPGFAAMPLAAIGGASTFGFIPLTILCFLLSLLIWIRVFRLLGVRYPAWIWLIMAVGFSSPLLFVTIRGDGIWFFAQSIGFLMTSLAIHEALAGRLVSAGVAISCAFLSRQMSIFYVPLLLIFSLRTEAPLLSAMPDKINRTIKLGIPVVAAIGIYLLYNQARFGSPFDSGYAYIDYPPGILKERLATHGLWSLSYLPFNLYHALVQGFHARFEGPGNMELVGIDRFGTAFLVASPWLAMLFFTPINRRTVFSGLLVAGLITVMLFYHSNGYTQYNVQRYMLDWLPAALVMLAYAIQRQKSPLFPLTVLWGMGLNAITIATMAVVH